MTIEIAVASQVSPTGANAAGLNLVAFSRYKTGALDGQIVALFVIVLAAAAGAAWAFIPALMKVRIGANEVITTMMFTYIGKYVVSWLVTGPLVAPGGIPQTVQLPVTSEMPRLSALILSLGTGRAHLGIVIAVVFAVVVWAVLKYTTLGYEARTVGYNPFASQAGGISVGATVIKSLCISGALAGVAGAVEVMGVYGRLFDNFSNNFGFTGIAVALLAKNNPLGVIAAALLFGALDAGAARDLLQHLPRLIAESRRPAHLCQRLPQHVPQEAHQHMRLHALLNLVPDRPQSQIALLNPERPLHRFGQLYVRLP